MEELSEFRQRPDLSPRISPLGFLSRSDDLVITKYSRKRRIELAIRAFRQREVSCERTERRIHFLVVQITTSENIKQLDTASYRSRRLPNQQEGRLTDVGVSVKASSSINNKTKVFVESPARLEGDLAMNGIIGAYSYTRKGGRLGGISAVGRYCSIGPGVRIADGEHPIEWMSTHPFQRGEAFWFEQHSAPSSSPDFPVTDKATIGHDVWIGANAIILKGVKISTGAVIAAGSVVTKNVPPYAVVAGVPATIKKYRFSPSTIEWLLTFGWWKYTASSLRGIPFTDIQKSVDELERRKQNSSLEIIAAPMVEITRRKTEVVADRTRCESVRQTLLSALDEVPTKPAAAGSLTHSYLIRAKYFLQSLRGDGRDT